MPTPHLSIMGRSRAAACDRTGGAEPKEQLVRQLERTVGEKWFGDRELKRERVRRVN